MLAWIPVLVVTAFLLGCALFTCASCLQICKIMFRRNINKVKPEPAYVKKSVPA